MKRTISRTASLSLAWLLCSLLPANAEDVPRRKAGLWELTTIGAGSGTNKAKTCIGENDKILSPEGGNCTEPKVTKGGEDTVIIDLVCTTAEGKETISGAFTGDFNTRYRAQVKMTFDPPPKGMLPYMGVTIDGKYLGPDCEAEKAPGEAK
jgi:uncharacterized protein DUF3617